MPLKKGSSQKVISQNIREFHQGPTYQKTSQKFGKSKADKQAIPGYRARRWVVERAHSWMNRYRRLLIRWEKKVDNYLALLHFACATIAFRAAGFRLAGVSG